VRSRGNQTKGKQNETLLIAKAEMLIRKPVAEVFEAFVNPAITSKFWFSKGSGRLETGKEVTWNWEMYHFSVSVKVKGVEQNARILVEWPAYGALALVEWIFKPRADATTFVSVIRVFRETKVKPCNMRLIRRKDSRLCWPERRRFSNTRLD